MARKARHAADELGTADELSDEELRAAQGGQLLKGPRFCGPGVPPCDTPFVKGTADREI